MKYRNALWVFRITGIETQFAGVYWDGKFHQQDIDECACGLDADLNNQDLLNVENRDV